MADAFSKGDAVIYVGDNERLPKGTKGWVVRELQDRRDIHFVRVDFPSCRHLSNRGGYWLILASSLERDRPAVEGETTYAHYARTAVPRSNPAASRFPHVCPRCAAPAYVGFSSVECSQGCR